MNRKEILVQIGTLAKQFLTFTKDAEVNIEKFEASAENVYKTNDGKKLTIDKLEKGGVVTMDGKPCSNGDYTLEDGTIITVGDNGIIMEIKPFTKEQEDKPEPVANAKEVTTEAPSTEPIPATQPDADDNKLDAKILDGINQIIALLNQLTQSENEEMTRKFSAIETKLADLNKVLDETPAPKPQRFNTTNVATSDEKNKLNVLREFRKSQSS